MKKSAPLLALIAFLMRCAPQPASKEVPPVPEWSQTAIYYQIFVERFRNGDPTNDPTAEDIRMTFPENIPANWAVTPWGQDWYAPDPYHVGMDSSYDFYSKIQLRRYGGDLRGVLDKVDYIASLGVTAVYFNPLNDAPSLHKYDPRYYHHIDRNFGPDPAGDKALMEAEKPNDPNTWQWTAADKMFLEVIKALHSRGIRVILDYSFNHTGYDFWAVNDIRQNGQSSEFVDWYEVEQFDDPQTPENETQIKGWWGFKYLPLFRENVQDPESRLPHEGNITSESLKKHIFDVSRRWLDPNGDGKFDDGVDGYRLDVAAEVTMGFWREYRDFVKDINPDALLIGEVWWFDENDPSGPEQMVQGDAFDGLMNYRWFRLAIDFFNADSSRLSPTGFVEGWKHINKGVNVPYQQAMMNVAGTHDTPRLSTILFNDGPFNSQNKLSENPTYRVHRPDSPTRQEMDNFLLHQFTFVGSPHIWNGDEMGMWGANDPDCRKPLWWDDVAFEPESAQAYLPRVHPPDEIGVDKKLTARYQSLIRLRKENPVFATGSLEFITSNDEKQLLGYARRSDNEEALVVFNQSGQTQTLNLPARYGRYKNGLTGTQQEVTNGQISVTLAPLSSEVWLGNQ